jgi:putative GTP pyrophosphokinase
MPGRNWQNGCMANAERSAAEWGDLYRERRTLYHSFSARLQSLLNELLASEGIGAAQVDARAKDVQSFIDKMGRRPGRYLDPLADITDLAGVRVVVYYSSDVELVNTMIEREFAVDEKNSWRRTPSTDPDRFGYRSDHYVVSCSTSRAGLGEWQPYVGLKAEIQVRTVLQHAWAAIDHTLNYKRASEIPAELKRQLFRISALLEVADDQFESVRLATGRLSSSYERSVSSGELGLPIDRASVEVYVEQSPRTERWTNSADKAGFNLDKAPWSDDLDGDMSDGIADLTQASQGVGFTDLAQLDAFLEQAEAWGEAALVAMRTGGRDGEWYVSPAFILASLVYIGSGISADDLETQSGGAKFYINSILRARDVVPSEPRASDVADQSRPQHR